MVRNTSRGLVLGHAVHRADSFWARLRGLMFRKRLQAGHGVLIWPCKAVHTHFMRFPIDLVFVDAQQRVLWVMTAVRPWKQSPFFRHAEAVLELPAYAAGTTGPGDALEFTD